MNTLKMSLRKIWTGVAADYLQGCRGQRCKGKEVQEVVLDRVDTWTLKPDDLRTWREFTTVERDALLNEIFPPKLWFSY